MMTRFLVLRSEAQGEPRSIGQAGRGSFYFSANRVPFSDAAFSGYRTCGYPLYKTLNEYGSARHADLP